MNKLTLLLAGMLATFLVAGTACAGGDTEPGEETTAQAHHTRQASPRPTPEPTAEPTPAPLPGWTRHTTAGFEIDLPDNWDAWNPTEESAEAIIQAAEANDPEHAEAVKELFAGEEAPDWAFAAIDAHSPVEFLTNFLVFEQESPVPMTVRSEIAVGEEQIRQLGYTLLSSDADLKIGGARAGRIEYALTCPCEEGMLFEAREVDYFVLPEPTRGFLLTFAATADEYRALKPIFEQIAESFRVPESRERAAIPGADIRAGAQLRADWDRGTKEWTQ